MTDVAGTTTSEGGIAPFAHRGSVRWQLRAATHGAHQALDDAVSALDLTSWSGYAAFLRMSAAVLLPLEDHLEAAEIENLLPDWRQRRRTSAIEKDLATLGLEARRMTLPQLPSDEASLLGALYVLEGSRLGARLLMRRVSASSETRLQSATIYLSHGHECRLWQSFLDVLEARITTKRELNQAAESARGTFALFAKALQDACAGSINKAA